MIVNPSFIGRRETSVPEIFCYQCLRPIFLASQYAMKLLVQKHTRSEVKNKPYSSDVWVYNKLIGKRRKVPSMMVARKNPLTCSLDGKLYVMGGCKGDESTCWAEVFNPKTQTWEPLSDPGVELRFSLIKKLQTEPGKVLLRSNNYNFYYLVEECSCEVYHTNIGESICKIDEVWYSDDQRECWLYDTKRREWRIVRGLTELCQEFSRELGRVEIGSYGGKLVIFWVGPALYPYLGTSRIWCAVILLKKHCGRCNEVWGQVEWADTVLTAPWSHTVRLCCGSQCNDQQSMLLHLTFCL